MEQRQPILFVPHGAPTFALEPGEAGAALAAAAARLPKPRAIVVVSAHWETDAPTVGCAANLPTIHDFWGFPAPLYDIRYPARGDLGVAEEVRRLLRRGGFEARLDDGRGLDHGAWIPLGIMYPAADIPVVPLSIQGRLGPAHHYRLGQALAPLAEAGILIITSGNLTHNLRDFQVAYARGGATPDYVPQFAEWAWKRIAAGDGQALLAYREEAPGGSRAHPTEDHLLPLHVALGAAGGNYRAERLHAGIDSMVLAMDSYAFWPGEAAVQPETKE